MGKQTCLTCLDLKKNASFDLVCKVINANPRQTHPWGMAFGHMDDPGGRLGPKINQVSLSPSLSNDHPKGMSDARALLLVGLRPPRTVHRTYRKPQNSASRRDPQSCYTVEGLVAGGEVDHTVSWAKAPWGKLLDMTKNDSKEKPVSVMSLEPCRTGKKHGGNLDSSSWRFQHLSTNWDTGSSSQFQDEKTQRYSKNL